MEKRAVLAFENASHEGNSGSYHTGKRCVTEGCKNPAGTKWSPLWCFEHNVQRMRKINETLGDLSRAAELSALVDKETESLRAWAYESARIVKAMVFAAGGEVTIKRSDLTREPSYEATSYGDETITYRAR